MNKEEFWELVVKTDGCWNWQGKVTKKGYGNAYFAGHNTTAHRVSWFLKHGYFPQLPITLDHLCRNHLCVNPKHLEAVTNKENILRGFGPPALNARKTHCKNGHEFSGSNVMRPAAGRRACRMCHFATVARCSRERRRKRIADPIPCAFCGASFARSRIGNKYCTEECCIRAHSLGRNREHEPECVRATALKIGV